MLVLDQIQLRYGNRLVLSLAALELAAREQVLLLGASGSGKTSLLHIAAGLLAPTQGRVSIAGTALDSLSGAALDRFRGRHVGIVFQRLHLIASLSVLQNLLVAQYCAGLPRDRGQALALLDSLGLAHKAATRPASLSQGQAQRVAIARAVINRPKLLLADEPTSSLDDAAAEAVLNVLCEQARACGAALLIATHDARAKRRIAQRIDLSPPPFEAAA